MVPRKFMNNSKGISVIFLIIAMLLMVIIGYVFSYLIPSKQKSVVFPIQSTQAFFIAQSGVEFAVRYATDNSWTTPALLNNLNIPPNNTRNLGAGSFTITYTNVAPNLDTLISVGEVPTGTERRRVRVSNFTRFLATGTLILDPNSPPPCLDIRRRRIGGTWYYQYEVTFYMRNITTSTPIILNSFRATWDADPPTIERVRFRNNTDRYINGSYSNGDPQTYFNTGPGGCTPPSCSYTINAQTTRRVLIRWNYTTAANCDFNNLIVYFYDTNGNMYTFTLDPGGDGIPDC